MDEIVISRATTEKLFESGAWRDRIEHIVMPQYRLASFRKMTFDTDFFEQDATFDITVNFQNNNPQVIDSITLTAKFQLPSASLIDLKLKMKKIVDEKIRNYMRDMESLKQDAQKLFQKCCNINPDSSDNNNSLLPSGLDCADDNVEEMQRNMGFLAEQIKSHQREIDKIKQDSIEIKNADTICEYTITLYRDRIKHINGLPGQKKSFSLCWFTSQDKNEQMIPSNISSIERSVRVMYSDLEKL